jgi:carbamoyltransferase
LIICGLKLTHDGAVALIEDGELVFSVEVEKLANNPRYSQVESSSVITAILRDFGYQATDVDRWVIDGWDGRHTGYANLTDQGRPLTLNLAPYRETDAVPDVFEPGLQGSFPLAGESLPTAATYTSRDISRVPTAPASSRGAASLRSSWSGTAACSPACTGSTPNAASRTAVSSSR